MSSDLPTWLWVLWVVVAVLTVLAICMPEVPAGHPVNVPESSTSDDMIYQTGPYFHP